MKDVIDEYWKLWQKLHTYGDEVITPDGDTGFFGACFNDVTLTIELLTYYYNLWKQNYQKPQEEIDRNKEENAQRVITITKWLFLAIVSAMEFDAKKKVTETNRPEFLELKNSLMTDEKVYLSDIMEKSRDTRLLLHDNFNNFEAILYIRHCLIHNNGISNKDRLYAPIKNQLRRFEKGKMIQGNLHTFYKFSDILVEYYRDWLKKF